MNSWVLVTGDFTPHGGMDRANCALASFLARAGHNVELVTHRVSPDLLALPRVRVRLVPRPLGLHFLGHWPLARAGALAGTAALLRGGRVVVNGGNCPGRDVNWVHYVHAAHHPELPVSRLRRLKARFERPLELRAERARGSYHPA